LRYFSITYVNRRKEYKYIWQKSKVAIEKKFYTKEGLNVHVKNNMLIIQRKGNENQSKFGIL
jgi:hypothetical protein